MKRIAIIGASGYAGAEVLRLLAGRDDVTVTAAFAAKNAGGRVDALYPQLGGRVDLVFEHLPSGSIPEADVAFVALPSGESMTVVPRLLDAVPRVIDLGGDFRLPSAEVYRQFYGHAHVASEMLGKVVYGLPELYREQIRDARLVANPGCYPTGAILALLPALRNGLIRTDHIVINALSGVSGAGRANSVELSFTEVNENVRAYKVGTHQHIPEIQMLLEAAAGTPVSVSFVPHLLPVTRGIYTTIHADLDRPVTPDDVRSVYADFYRESPFVRITMQPPQLRSVQLTNFCDIGFAMQQRTGQLILMSAIDNLVKGAAGQAVQNMNIMLGLPEERALV